MHAQEFLFASNYRRTGRLKKWKGLFSAYDTHLSICWHLACCHLAIGISSPFMRASHFLSNKCFCKHSSGLCVMSSEHWQAFTSIWAIFVWHWMLISGHRLLRVTCFNSCLASVEPTYLVTAKLLSEMGSEFEPVGLWQIVGGSEQQTDPLYCFTLLWKIEIIGGTCFACFKCRKRFLWQSPSLANPPVWVSGKLYGYVDVIVNGNWYHLELCTDKLKIYYGSFREPAWCTHNVWQGQP